jgi:hypothetical protein
MVNLDLESVAPKIWAAVAHDIDKADQLPFIGHQFGMSSSNRSAEVGDRATALVKDEVEPDP